MTGENVSSQEGSSDDFVQEMLALIHNRTETVATPTDLAGIYRHGFVYGQEVAGLSTFQALLFGMAYGNFALGGFNEEESIRTIHQHAAMLPYEEESSPVIHRPAWESARIYLYNQFHTRDAPERRSMSLLWNLQQLYNQEGVYPNPVKNADQFHLLLMDTAAFYAATTSAEFAVKLQQISRLAEPSLIRHPERFLRFEEETTRMGLNVWEDTLSQVESGEYLFRQEGIESS